MDAKGNLTNLINAVKLDIFDGSKETLSLAYGKLSEMPRLDVIVGSNFLQGEVLILKNYADLVIDNNKVTEVKPILLPFRKEKAIYVGYYGDSSSISYKNVIFTVPFPFRDSSIDSAVIFEVIDLDLVREVHRVLKTNSKAYLVLRDVVFGGINPVEGIKRISAKFKVVRVKEKEGFWIIEGVKIK
ncbi:hypothetical protein BFU36_01115 [Sulfolobus sp. A20]|nr:hypothetical protein BFU36_01115 [Sulfolobus sp. A20]